MLGIITGIILTLALAPYINKSDESDITENESDDSGIPGLELYDEPGEYMEYSRLEIFQVLDSGYALARGGEVLCDEVVFIIPDENQDFYDGQKIELKGELCAQRVGTYRYGNRLFGMGKTVPAIRIVAATEVPGSSRQVAGKGEGKTIFDKPGDCVSRKSFEVQKVLESGDAIALEIRDAIDGYIFTSDLKVLIQAKDGSNFYDKQIVKAPRGKSARQIGNYKYQEYGRVKVIPIIDFL